MKIATNNPSVFDRNSNDFIIDDKGQAFISVSETENLLGLRQGAIRDLVSNISLYEITKQEGSGDEFLSVKSFQNVTSHYAAKGNKYAVTLIESISKTHFMIGGCGAQAFIYRGAGYDIDFDGFFKPSSAKVNPKKVNVSHEINLDYDVSKNHFMVEGLSVCLVEIKVKVSKSNGIQYYYFNKTSHKSDPDENNEEHHTFYIDEDVKGNIYDNIEDSKEALCKLIMNSNLKNLS